MRTLETNTQISDSVLSDNIGAIHMAVFENHPEAVFVLDSDGYYRQYNKQTCSILGYTAQDYVNRKFGDMTPGLHRELARQTVQKAVKGESQQFVLNTQYRDGRKAYLQTTLVPVTINGHVWIMGFSKDITPQIKMERELRENQEQLAKAHEIAKLGNWCLDIENNTIALNESARDIYGVPDCVMPADKGVENIHPDDYERVMDITMRSIYEQGLVKDVEYRVVHPDGTVRYVHALGKVDNTAERPTLFGTVQDITERKRTEEMLVNSEKLAVVGQLAAGMAHEIRNPLTVAKGLIQLLESAPVDMPQQSSYFQLIKESLNQIDFITDQMLVLAKPQAESRIANNVVSIVQDIVNVFRAEALLHNVAINYSCDTQSIPVMCNEPRIKQVFLNIMKNAFEAAARECKITVGVVPDEDKVCITFIDDGHGIDPERIKSIGEPFYTTKEKGTGLGLLISKKIVRDHDGELQFSSEVGRGTTVTVTLPISNIQSVTPHHV